MFTSDRRVLVAGASAALPPGLLLCVLLWSPDLCADAWNVSDLKGAFPAERRREEKLNREQEALLRRLRAKADLARGLADRRLTLLEAAARARALDRQAPGFAWDAFRRTLPERSDEERHCREVIGYVLATCPLGATASAELARRLETELQDHLDRGTLRLPDVGDENDLSFRARSANR